MNVEKRFLKYVGFPTMSDGSYKTCPSTSGQRKLAEYLAAELTEIGMKNVRLDENGYVYAELDANTDKPVNTVGFIAHMDTSSAAPDKVIKAKTVRYEGGDIVLNEEKNIRLSPSDYPELERYKGDRLIVTDGTTLLGADDKAGIAEIVTAMEYVIKHGVTHGPLRVGFTPDEEIGRGADRFDVAGFGADYAYTLDGGALGEIEFENFNAAGAGVKIKGISIHPGSAKNKMINAAAIACEFNALLPKDEVPEKTEGYEGFHFLSSINGSTEEASLSYIIRDHDKEKLEEKKRGFTSAAEKLNSIYGEGTVEVRLHDSYSNMREIIEKHMYTVDRAAEAMRACGTEPRVIPIRGGTDGARLSYMGLPCPNLCTGGENFHSRFEYISVESMEKITDITVKLIENAVEQGKA